MTDIDAAQPALDLEQVDEWATMLMPDGPGYAVISWPSGTTWASQAFDTGDEDYPASLCSFVERVQKSRPKGIYLRMTTVLEPPAKGKRGERDVSASLPAFWLDMDIEGPGHKSGSHEHPLPPDRTTLWNIINHSGMPQPTLWLSSGGGLYPIWVFKQNIALTDENRDHWAALSEQWNRIFIRAAADLGWHLDSTHNLDRVLRIPGTINYKVPDAPTQAKFFHEDEDSKTIDPDDIEGIVAAGLVRWPEPVRQMPTSPPRQRISGEVTPGDDFNAQMTPDRFFNEILEPNGWTYHSRDNKATYLTRPGKDAREGLSASLDLNGSGNLYIMSSAAFPFAEGEPYTPFAAYTLITYGSTRPEAFRAATKDLARQGYGTPLKRRDGFANMITGATEPAASSSKQEVSAPISTPPAATLTPSTATSPVVEGTIEDGPGRLRFRRHTLDDRGNALRLYDRLKATVKWLPRQNQWVTWKGNRWELCEAGAEEMMQHAGTIMDADLLLFEEGEFWSEEPEVGSRGRETMSPRERFLRHISSSRATARLKAALEQLKGLPGISTTIGAFDAVPYMINVANGVLDMRTGTLAPHAPELMQMNHVPVMWQPDAECPQFMAFLERSQPENEMREYLQRVLGYTMSGYTSEQVMFIHRGSGANGKSVLMETMAHMMGEFYHKAPSSMLLTGFGDKIPADIADLNGTRMVVMSETARGRTMNEDLMRDLCGGERINARRLYGHFFQFEPVCKMHLVTNHMPMISDAPATWRRLRVINWKVVIPRADWIKNLPAKFFSEEAAGILVWLVAGFRQWLADGDLWEPASVTEETGEEREDQDTLGEFIAECCDTATPDGEEVSDSSTNINQAYRMWAERAGIRYPLSRRSLIMTLQERAGIERVHKETYRGLKGIRVKPVDKRQWIGSRLPIDS